MSKQAKYRPSLTAKQISYILSLAKKDYAELASQEPLDIIAILSPFLAKIEVGAITISHTATNKKDLVKEFGTASSSPIPSEFSTKEEYWEHCYELYREGTPELSISELNAAKEHMYLNDLMSPEEVAEYEKLDITKNL